MAENSPYFFNFKYGRYDGFRMKATKDKFKQVFKDGGLHMQVTSKYYAQYVLDFDISDDATGEAHLVFVQYTYMST